MVNNLPVCVACSLGISKVTRYFPKTNGFVTNYGHNGVAHGDLMECPVCGNQIVVGFGDEADYGDHSGSVRKYVDPIMVGVTDSDGVKRLDFHLQDRDGLFIKNIRVPDTDEARTYAIVVNSAYYCVPGWYREDDDDDE